MRGVTAASAASAIDVVVVGPTTSTTTGVAARLRDRLEGRDERLRRDDHLVTRLEPGRDQREPERIEAARDADAGRRPQYAANDGFELRHLRAVDEAAAVDQAGKVVEDLGLEAVHHRGAVEERHRARAVCMSDRRHLSL